VPIAGEGKMTPKGNHRTARALLGAIVIGSLAIPPESLRACDSIPELHYVTDGHAAQLTGSTVAISGSVALVSATGDYDYGQNAGAVFAFRRTSQGWVQEQRLIPSQLGAFDRFGLGLAVDGDVAVVGAYGQGVAGTVWVFRYAGGEWVVEDSLVPPDGVSGDSFGVSVAVSGNVILVGAPGVDDRATDAGAAYLYRFDGRAWQQEAKIYAPDAAASDRFGGKVALDGNVAAVGSVLNDDLGDASGSIYVYRYGGSSWAYEALLLSENGVAQDRLGSALAVSGNIIAAGMERYDLLNTRTGAALVFAYDGSRWSQRATLLASDGQYGDQFGYSIDVSGSTIVVGAPGRDSAGMSDSGAAYAFSFNGSTWQETDLLLPQRSWLGDTFGTAVAIDGTTVVAGAPNDDDLGNNSGSFTVFDDICVETGCQTNADCDDGLFCNGTETCLSGACYAGTPPCSGSLCNESSDACVECLSNGDCDDGVYCNGAERCVSGSCQASSPPCGAGLCNESSDACVECLSNGDCDDGVYCNGAERCVSGSCQAGSPPCSGSLCNESSDACVECLSTSDCDDGNPCTTDSCIGNACQHGSVADCCLTHADCDDSDSCTDDRCYLNRCVHQEVCECRVNADCDDGAYCNGAERCIGNTCVAGTAPCSGILCDESSDACVECFTGADCGDGNPCTNDACIGGSCTHGAIANCCTSHSQCDDGDACTDDRCVLNRCQSQNVCECRSNADCNDGDVCTADACVSNACSYVPISNCCTANGDCDDGDACTDDVCVANRCQHVDVCECQFDAECDDADPCTNDICLNHACKHSAIAGCCTSHSQCNDGDACTEDRCVLNRCQNTDTCECRQDGDCDDGNVCTNDACVGNVCVFSAIEGCCNSAAECDDGDSCTLDLCVSAQCQHTQECECASYSDCDDGDSCTSDQCVGGVCQHTGSCSGCTSSAECNDNNPCTTDVCTAGVCGHEAVSGCCTTSSQCDDGDDCTTDTCVDHACVNVASCACRVSGDCDDGDPCTDDTCDAGVCLNAPNHVCEAFRPAIVTVTASFAELVGQIAVDWGEPVDGVEYLVYRCDNEDIGSCTARTGWMAGTSFVDEDVEPGKIYWYRVRGRNEYGESDYSLPTSGSALQAPDANAPNDPTGADPNNGDITAAEAGGTQNSEVTDGGDAGCTGSDCPSGPSPDANNHGSGGVSNPCGALGGSLAFMLIGLSMLRFSRPRRRRAGARTSQV